MRLRMTKHEDRFSSRALRPRVEASSRDVHWRDEIQQCR